MKNLSVFIVMLLAISNCLYAQKAEIFSTGEGAIKGYDPVAYFTEKKPVKGKDNITYQWKGVKWKFASAQNLESFKANPEKYAPQYGGYCAYGVAKGYAVKIEPDAWDIVDGKLYLNYDKSVQKSWKEKKGEYIQTANQQWPQVLKK